MLVADDGQRRGVGQELLLGVAQRVGGAADHVAQQERKRRQPRLGGQKPLDRRGADAQQLGLDERGLGAEVGIQVLHLLLHALRLGQARVLVGHHAGVDVEARELLVEPRHQLEGVGQRRRRRARAGLRRRATAAVSAAIASLRARHAAASGIDVGEVPLVGVGNLGAVALLRGQRRGHDRLVYRQTSTRPATPFSWCPLE